MDHNTTADPAATALVLLALGIETLVKQLLVPALALLLTLASYLRPWPTKATSTPAATARPQLPPAPTVWAFPFAQPQPVVATTRQAFYEALTVHQLRQLARNKGHRKLARSGRRAQLLEVLA